MNQNPENHHRKSIRLKGYDYSHEGLYFITICCKNRKSFFGKIENGKMLLNEIGEIAFEYSASIPQHYSQSKLHEFIVMPNHMHSMIELVEPRHGVVPQPIMRSINQFGKPIPGSISVIINQYKSSVQRPCNQNAFAFFKWQSRFHDHIIRNEKSYLNISRYILNNPEKWDEDKFFKDSL